MRLKYSDRGTVLLSIVSIKSSSIQSGYYLKQDGGYYIEDAAQKNLYQWMGQGAADLGLEGTINEVDHARVFNGVLPGGIEVGKRNADGTLNGRPGYDLTFSMNKDISLIICCTNNKELKEYFLEAHINAVKTAMGEVERMVSARKTTEGKTSYEPTKKMIAALCTHFSSRAGDPQVHTHACVANATQRADGEWRALSTDMQRKHGFYEKIRDNATFLGHVYQNEMAIAAKNKGFDVERINKHGMFEIKSFPEDIRQHFSKRREQIEKIVESLPSAQKNNKKLFDAVAQNSKAAKDKISTNDFMVKAKSEMQSYLETNNYSKSFDGVVNECSKSQTLHKTIDSPSAREAVSDAVSHLSRFSVALDINKIINEAINYDLGGSSIASLQNVINQDIKTGKLLKTSEGLFTTPALIAQENNLLDTVSATLSSGSINATSIKSVLAENRLCVVREPKLLDEKMHALDQMIVELEHSGNTVKVLTQTSSMSSKHNEHIRNQNNNIWQQLKNLGKDNRAQSMLGFLHQYEERASNPLANLFNNKKKEVFIVEDAQRMSIDAAQKLIDLTAKNGSKIIFMSYDEGRRSRLSGDALSIIEKAGVGCVKAQSSVKENISDINYKIHDVKIDINANKAQKLIARHEHIATDVVTKFGSNIANVDIYTSSPRNVATLTDAIRLKLKDHGCIGQEDRNIIVEKNVYLSNEEKKHAKFFKVGMTAKTYVSAGVYSEYVITRIDEEKNKLLVTCAFGRERYVTPAKFLGDSDTRIHMTEKLMLADRDLIKINKINTRSNRLGLSENTNYKVSMEGNKILLVPTAERLKVIKTDIKQLSGMDLAHSYVGTIAQMTKLKKSTKHAVLDSAAYSLNKETLRDFNRVYKDIDIYTDSHKRAEIKLGVASAVKLASNLSIERSSTDGSVAARAVQYGLSIAASRDAAFTYNSVIEKSLGYGLAKVNLEDIRSEIAQEVQNGNLFARQNEYGDVLLATKEAIAIENKIISQIKDGKNAVTPFMQESEITQSLAASALTKGQKEACVLLASTPDRFVMVQGYAGTGKSTMLYTLKQSLEQHASIYKDNIIALAPTHRAAKELREKGLEDDTLKSFLIRAQSPETKNDYLDNKLILLDESSMVENSDFQALQSIVEKAKNCHCAYIGDIAQLSAVGAGKPSELAYIAKEAEIKIATMDEVLRQKNLELKEVAKDLMQGTNVHVQKAFASLERHGCIKQSNEFIDKLAKDYCSMTPSERDQTVVAIATNKNRQATNAAIRNELIKQGDLSGDVISTTILIDSRMTNSELRHAMNYKTGDVLKFNNDYLDVKKIHKELNTIELKDRAGESKVLNLGLMPKNTTLELFSSEVINIQSGDKLKWTKSDKERQLLAHDSLRVVSVNAKDQIIAVKDENNNILQIDLQQRQNSHLDYSYTSTVHGLQGATAKNVMVLLDSNNKQSNTMRLMYVAATRATHNASIYTDDINAIKRQISNTRGDKSSALESMGLLGINDKTIINADTSRPDKDKLNQTNINQNIRSQRDKSFKIDSKSVEQSMRQQAEHICKNILGNPNKSLSNANNWRYGSKGSLSVSVGGSRQGSFHNFETGEKGGMIQLLMSEMGMDFKSALEAGHKMIGGHTLNDLDTKRTQDVSAIKSISVDDKKQEYISSLIANSIPIKGTVAEKYLLSRGIQNTDNTNLRMLKKVKTGSGNLDIKPFASALLSIANDKNGTPTAVQLTYLHPIHGTKLTECPISKRTVGSLQNSFVDLNPNAKSPSISVIAEGVETALSIRDQLQSIGRGDVQVLASLGKSNLHKLGDNISDKIILALDNDKQDWRQDKGISSVIKSLEESGKKVVCMQPDIINGNKTDYNDLAKLNMHSMIKNDIQRSLAFVERENVRLNSEKNNHRGEEIGRI